MPLVNGQQIAQGVAFFPGIGFIHSASYTLNHGISASSATIECAPQDNFPAPVGDLVFSFAGLTLTFPKMCLNLHTIRRNEQGKIWSLQLWDRRWKWNAGTGTFGPLFAAYNVRLPDGSLDPIRTRTAQQLATICLDIMGEQGYDVTQMPNFTYPYVDWAGENPAQALATLCEVEGCRVVLRIDNTVLIAKTGVGQTPPVFPQVPVMEDSTSVTPPQRPDALLVCCGPSRFQVDLPLEAVGQDIDGSIRPINELSYTPTQGWPSESPPSFVNVQRTPSFFGAIPQQLAERTVFRWYRVAVPCYVPGWNAFVNDLRQMLPLEDIQVATFIDVGTFPATERYKPADVLGSFFDGKETYTNIGPFEFYKLPFTVDTTYGIVKFSEAVFAYGITWTVTVGGTPAASQIYSIHANGVPLLYVAKSGDGNNQIAQGLYASLVGYNNTTDNQGNVSLTCSGSTITVNVLTLSGVNFVLDTPAATGTGTVTLSEAMRSRLPADLSLRTAVNVRIPQAWSHTRFLWELVYPGPKFNTGPRVLRHDEIIYQTIPVYAYDSTSLLQSYQNINPFAILQANGQLGYLPFTLSTQGNLNSNQGPQAASPSQPQGMQGFSVAGAATIYSQEMPPAQTDQGNVFTSVPIQDPGIGGGVPNQPHLVGLLTNAAGVIREANYYLAAADLEYQIVPARRVLYAGLIPVSPDGAIQQVAWKVSADTGCTTEVGYNNEYDIHLPPYRERRFYEEWRNDWIKRVKDLAAGADLLPGVAKDILGRRGEL